MLNLKNIKSVFQKKSPKNLIPRRIRNRIRIQNYLYKSRIRIEKNTFRIHNTAYKEKLTK